VLALSIIRVNDLTFDYPGNRALDDVSFEIPENSITALVGPNGAGKTTLMRCLAALERPLHGDIHLDGIDVLQKPRECHRRVGYLSDFFGLYQDLTVQQCLHFVAASHGIDDVDTSVSSTIKLLDFEYYQHSKAGELSRGWRQRLGIAQAIIHRPKVLLLDEPASGLDPEARGKLAALLRKLGSEGMTVIVSSHILAELSEYSSHMLILEDGRVVEYTPIGTEQQAGAVRLHIQLAANHDGFEKVLSSSPDFTLDTSDALNARGFFQGDESSRADFLKNLIDANLPISRFELVDDDMQKVYLQIIQNKRNENSAST
jgi:ABC-2 type transport system ATP-binding protein